MPQLSDPEKLDAKRALDLVASGMGLVISAPVFAVVAAAILIHDGRPVFFRQERIGLEGKPFRIHKFRSMKNSNAGSLVTSAHDDRITPIGAFLRKTKLDELPQLIDVFTGSMSLVGPRPEVAKYVTLWGDQAVQDEILSVRPGITDPASITFRNEQDELAAADDPEAHYVDVILPRKVAMYRQYVRRHTFLGDLEILGRTLLTVLRD